MFDLKILRKFELIRYKQLNIRRRLCPHVRAKHLVCIKIIEGESDNKSSCSVYTMLRDRKSEHKRKRKNFRNFR